MNVLYFYNVVNRPDYLEKIVVSSNLCQKISHNYDYEIQDTYISSISSGPSHTSTHKDIKYFICGQNKYSKLNNVQLEIIATNIIYCDLFNITYVSVLTTYSIKIFFSNYFCPTNLCIILCGLKTCRTIKNTPTGQWSTFVRSAFSHHIKRNWS